MDAVVAISLSFSLFLCGQLADEFGDLATYPRDLGDELLGGHTADSCGEGRDLEEVVSRDHTDGIIGAQIVDNLFNVGVGSLVLLGRPSER